MSFFNSAIVNTSVNLADGKKQEFMTSFLTGFWAQACLTEYLDRQEKLPLTAESMTVPIYSKASGVMANIAEGADAVGTKTKVVKRTFGFTPKQTNVEVTNYAIAVTGGDAFVAAAKSLGQAYVEGMEGYAWNPLTQAGDTFKYLVPGRSSSTTAITNVAATEKMSLGYLQEVYQEMHGALVPKTANGNYVAFMSVSQMADLQASSGALWQTRQYVNDQTGAAPYNQSALPTASIGGFDIYVTAYTPKTAQTTPAIPVHKCMFMGADAIRKAYHINNPLTFHDEWSDKGHTGRLLYVTEYSDYHVYRPECLVWGQTAVTRNV